MIVDLHATPITLPRRLATVHILGVQIEVSLPVGGEVTDVTSVQLGHGVHELMSLHVAIKHGRVVAVLAEIRVIGSA